MGVLRHDIISLARDSVSTVLMAVTKHPAICSPTTGEARPLNFFSRSETVTGFSGSPRGQSVCAVNVRPSSVLSREPATWRDARRQDPAPQPQGHSTHDFPDQGIMMLYNPMQAQGQYQDGPAGPLKYPGLGTQCVSPPRYTNRDISICTAPMMKKTMTTTRLAYH